MATVSPTTNKSCGGGDVGVACSRQRRSDQTDAHVPLSTVRQREARRSPCCDSSPSVFHVCSLRGAAGESGVPPARSTPPVTATWGRQSGSRSGFGDRRPNRRPLAPDRARPPLIDESSWGVQGGLTRVPSRLGITLQLSLWPLPFTTHRHINAHIFRSAPPHHPAPPTLGASFCHGSH